MVEALLEEARPWLTPTYLFLLLNLVIATILISSAFSNRLKHPPSPPLSRTPSLFSRVTSFNFSTYHQHQHQQQQQQQPSFFSRVASFNFSGQAAHVESATLEQDSRDLVTEAGEVHAHNEKQQRQHNINTDNSYSQAGDHVESATYEQDSRDTITHARSRTQHGHVTVGKEARAPYLLSRIASFTLRKRETQVGASEVYTHYPEQVQATKKNKMNKQKKAAEAEAEAKAEAEMEMEMEMEMEDQMTESKKRHEEEDAKADDFINRFKQQLKMQRLDSLMRYRSA